MARSRSAAREDRLGLLIIAGVVIACLGIGIWVGLQSQKPKPSGDMGCLNGQAGNVVAVLVDKSDSFTEAQQDEVRRLFGKIVEGLQENDLLSIYILSDERAMEAKPAFAMCAPKRDGNPLYENRKRIKQAFDKGFGNRLNSIIEGSIQSQSVESSPLLEMVQRISRSSYFEPQPERKRDLYVLSDMMQHTKGFSFYSQKVSLEGLTATDYGKSLLADTSLSGTTVQLIIIPRPGEVGFDKSQDVKKFWIDYLRQMKVAAVNPRVLP